MPASLNDLLHTLGENVVFRTEQEERDFHAGVDELHQDDAADQGDEHQGDEHQGEHVPAEKPSPKTVAARAGAKS
jgi:hypothetical protein